MILQEIDMLQIRMEFDLVDGWRNRCCLQDPVKLLREVVAHANRLCEALTFEFFHLLPLGLVVFFFVAEKRRVDEIPTEIISTDIIALQLKATNKST